MTADEKRYWSWVAAAIVSVVLLAIAIAISAKGDDDGGSSGPVDIVEVGQEQVSYECDVEVEDLTYTGDTGNHLLYEDPSGTQMSIRWDLHTNPETGNEYKTVNPAMIDCGG